MQTQTEPIKLNVDNRWLYNLKPEVFPKVCEFMRAIRGRADALMEQHRKIQPRYGEVGGSAHMDPFVRSDALSLFLNRLGKGDSPEVAIQAAKEESVLCWTKWNAKCRDIHMKRWEKADEAYLDDVHRSLLRVIESVNCQGCG